MPDRRLLEPPIIDDVSEWAALRDDVLGLAVVGSYARGAAQPDSDIDFVLVSADPALYLNDTEWVSAFGEVASLSFEDWGKVQSVRVFYRNGPEVEFGIAVAQRGLWREAIYRWERAVQIDATYAAAHNNLAIAYEHEGELDKARAEKLSPHCPEIQGCIRCGVCVETPNPLYKLPEKWRELGTSPRYLKVNAPA